VLRREEKLVHLQVLWKLNEQKLERLLEASSDMPIVKKRYNREDGGAMQLDFGSLLQGSSTFVDWSSRNVLPLLTSGNRSELKAKIDHVESLLSRTTGSIIGGSSTVTLEDAGAIRQLEDAARESIQLEIDDMLSQASRFAPAVRKQGKFQWPYS